MHIVQFKTVDIAQSYIDSMKQTAQAAASAGVQYEAVELTGDGDPRVLAEIAKLEYCAKYPDVFIIDADDAFDSIPDMPLNGKPYFDYIHGCNPSSPIHPSGGTIYCNGCCALFNPMIERYKQYMYYGAIRRKILWDVPGYEIDSACHVHNFYTRRSRGKAKIAAK